MPKTRTHEELIAACSAGRSQVAAAPCFFEVSQDQGPAFAGAGHLVELQVTPAGAFRPRDNRELPVAAWHIDAASAAAVIARFKARKTPTVLDYEHQTLLAEDNGHAAPAAGWFRDLVWKEGLGLFATIELTVRAKEYVANGEYRYFSPVIAYDTTTGVVLDLLMGALTNNPAIDGMAPVALRAAARFALTTEEQPVKKNLLAIAIAHCCLAATATEDEAVTALTARLAQDPLDQVRKDLGLAADIGVAEISTAIASLKTQAAAGKPDPAKFVSIDVVTDLQTQVAALTTKQNQDEVNVLVTGALADGRLIASMEPWARELGKSDVAALKSYIAAAQPIAALKGTQTNGKDPTKPEGEAGLTAEEVAVCRNTGISVEDFKKQKTPATA